MKKHLYNTTLGKAPWFIKRFGAGEVLMKPLRHRFKSPFPCANAVVIAEFART